MGKSTNDFLAVTEARRTFYSLEAKSPVPDSEIVSILEAALLNVPSAFNSQSTRMALLLSSNHQKLWEITGSALKRKIGEERYEASTKGKIQSFGGAYGTVLFFDDPNHEEPLRKMGGALYEDKVSEWTHQSQGMHQYFVWTALETQGFGVNLQHYNPLIDDEVKETWDLPRDWRLKAQMVFGSVKDSPKAKEQKHPMDARLKIFGVST